MACTSIVVLTVMLSTSTSVRDRSLNYCKAAALTQSGRDPGAYAIRNAGAFCDGSVFVPHASGAADLPVVGVTAGPIGGGLPVSVTVVQPPVDDADFPWPIRIEGMATGSINYRFDSALDRGEYLSVGEGSGLAILKLPLENITWAAWAESPTLGRVYLPVVMTSRPLGDVTVQVRPTYATSAVRFTVRAGSVTIHHGTNGPIAAGALSAFTIPAGHPGTVSVRVEAIGSKHAPQVAEFALVLPETRP